MSRYTISGHLTLCDPDGNAVTWEYYVATFDAPTHSEAKQHWTDVDSAVDEALSSLPISADGKGESHG